MQLFIRPTALIIKTIHTLHIGTFNKIEQDCHPKQQVPDGKWTRKPLAYGESIFSSMCSLPLSDICQFYF